MIDYCRKCYEFSVDKNLERSIESYLDRIPEDEKVSEEVYAQRLGECNQCEMLRNGMCGFCGCFVIVRAIKSGMSCPKPSDCRW